MTNSNRKIILIAEDDKIIRDLYKDELEKGGFIIYQAVDGIEALELVKEKQPDLVLLDIMMPRKSGLDVLAEMKQDENLAKIPVFILSALGDPDDKARGLALGAVNYIAKAETIPGKVISEVKRFFTDQEKE